MVKNLGDPVKKLDINIIFGEDTINVATVAMQFSGKPAYGARLRHGVKHSLYPFAYLHRAQTHHAGRTPPRAVKV